MKNLPRRSKKILLLLFFYVSNAQAQLPAFPGAEGMGKFTSGGRGNSTVASTVMEVTNLNDDNLPGSLRYAATALSGITHRTVIFRVSGTIHLNSRLSLNRPNTTIAGQTAPGDGICIADYPVAISTDNLIVRYIRFRLGDKNQNKGMINGSGDDDAFSGTGHKNIIIDHCTMSWSDDEAFTVYDGDSTTLQWNLISEPLDYSYHFETGDADFEKHGYGGIWGGRHTTAHHNLIAHCRGRMPRFSGSRYLGDGATPGLENVDFRNNVIYNWSSYNTNGGEGGNYNIVNNYYKYGPSTPNSASTRGMIINPFKTPPLPYGKYYLTGNYVDGSVARTNNNWFGAVMSGGTAADTALAKVTVPFPLFSMATESAQEAYKSVLNKAGCSLPKRDTLDERIVSNVVNRTGKIIDVQGGYPHGTPYATTVAAWPALNAAPPAADVDGDKIPDEWIAQRGLSGVPLSGAGGYHINGYTHLENFLNGDSIVAAGTVNTCVDAGMVISTNSGAWLESKDNSYTRLVSTDTNNIVAAILDDGNYDGLNVFYYKSGSPRKFTRVPEYGVDVPYLDRNFLIKPDIATTGEGIFKIRLYFTAEEFTTLKNTDASITSLEDLRILHVTDEPDLICGDVIRDEWPLTSYEPSASGIYGTYQNGYYLEFESPEVTGAFFIIGKANIAVPLKLVSFNAITNGNQVTTNWSTVNEINAKTFFVERSTDGRNFSTIGSREGVNSVNTKNYIFIDAVPLDGISYYRLRLTDNNGSVRYSQVVAVNRKSVAVIKVSPNPVRNSLVVSYPKALPGAMLQVAGADGKNMMQPVISAGTTASLLDVTTLPKGIYMITYINGTDRQAVKFVKQ